MKKMVKREGKTNGIKKENDIGQKNEKRLEKKKK